MEFIRTIIGFIFHIDKYIPGIIQNCGTWSYAVLVLIIFIETGLVVMPFLPGDSLLFAVGTFAAQGWFNIFWLFVTLSLAAIIGDSVNYAVGKYFGEKLFRNEKSRIFKREYLERTHKFYEKHGGKTIVIARFVPIIRTFAPFVAGIGKMSYFHFILYNISGGLLWVAIFVFGGFYFGNIPLIKNNFTLAIFVIIFLSILPGIFEFIKEYKHNTCFKK